jgi:tRNA(adenine34) deaminase
MQIKNSSNNQDQLWMEEALKEAAQAAAAGEVPIGAVVVCAGKIVGRGGNRVIEDSDPTAHAEIVALRQAANVLGNYRLGDCELFATIEPCAMCAGAMVHARLKTLVYGTDDPKAGAVRSVMAVLNHPQLNHKMEVRSGVLADRCAQLLQDFFRSKRAETR